MSDLYNDLPLTSFPNFIDDFPNMLNISTFDAPLVRQYQQAIQNENFGLAQQILTQIPSYSQKILTAEKLNKVGQSSTAIERFYKTDIQPFVSQKQSEWQNIINQFNYYGVWSPTQQYAINNFVQYQVQGATYLYIVTSPPPIGIAPTNSLYWRQLTIRGTKGDSGIGMAFMYAWASDINYTVQDVVSYNNGLWGATQNNQNQPPYEGSSYWDLVYKGTITVYPIQSNEPTAQPIGGLWFKII